MAVLGLTGGFLSGKSTVTHIFAEKGLEVIDTDKIYHLICENNPDVKEKLTAAFGKDILTGGKIDREKLKHQVFSDTEGLRRISRVTHPYIIAELKDKIEHYRNKAKNVIAEVPLLYESEIAALFDKIIAVICSRQNQLDRAKQSGYLKSQVKAIMQAQMPLHDKAKRADYVINNNSDEQDLNRQVERVLKEIFRDINNKN